MGTKRYSSSLPLINFLKKLFVELTKFRFLILNNLQLKPGCWLAISGMIRLAKGELSAAIKYANTATTIEHIIITIPKAAPLFFRSLLRKEDLCFKNNINSEVLFANV